jgi:hypothetical protein
MTVLFFSQVHAQSFLRINLKNGNVIEVPISSIRKLTFDSLDNFIEYPALVNQLIKMKLFPNPSEDFVNIEYNLTDQGEVTLQIYAMNGKVYKPINLGIQQPGKNTYRLQTLHLEPGSYVCSLRQKNDCITDIMIVKH